MTQVRTRTRKPAKARPYLDDSPMLVRFPMSEAGIIRRLALAAQVDDVTFVRGIVANICQRLDEAQKPAP